MEGSGHYSNPINVDNEMEDVEDKIQESQSVEMVKSNKRPKSLTSDVWKSITKIGVADDGIERAKCNGCQTIYKWDDDEKDLKDVNVETSSSNKASNLELKPKLHLNGVNLMVMNILNCKILPSFSFGCKRNLSAIEMVKFQPCTLYSILKIIHTKRINCLMQKTMNDVVYVMANSKLAKKKKFRKLYNTQNSGFGCLLQQRVWLKIGATFHVWEGGGRE
ncbi:hypothetical protein Lal_00041554 [Lupinus albus]|nr:hypothetical protein Lal_00041554 [Lupinus albus]